MLEITKTLACVLETLLESTEPTNTYCEFCDSHAHKEASDGINIDWIGPINHKEDCIRAEAEKILGEAKNLLG